MAFTLLDGILLVIMLISAILAAIRGFIREILSIAAWLAAALAALYFYDRLMPVTERYISNHNLALAASAAIIFLVTLMIVSFLTMRLSDFVLESAIGPVDRSLGFVFGAIRGFLLVVVAVLLFNFFVPASSASQPAWIANARTKPLLDNVGGRLMAMLPENEERNITKLFLEHSSPNSRPAEATPVAPGDTQPGSAGATESPQDRQGLNAVIQSTTQ